MQLYSIWVDFLRYVYIVWNEVQKCKDWNTNNVKVDQIDVR